MALEDVVDSLKNFDMDQLNDLNSVGSWPLAVKLIMWVLAFVGALTAGYFFHVWICRVRTTVDLHMLLISPSRLCAMWVTRMCDL